MTDNVRKLIILGSGPAGLTAAIYAARGQLQPLVLAGEKYGGQLMNTTLVENWPGNKNGIMGPSLMLEMIEQAKNQGAEIINKSCTRVDFSAAIKKVWAGAEEFQARAIILAVGSSPRTLGVAGEAEFYGKGVATCATCDGAFYRDKVVAIVGGGDSAMEEANFLTKFARRVYIIHRQDTFNASKVMQEKVFHNDQIEIIWNTEVKAVLGDQTVKKLKIFNNKAKQESELAVDGMFLAIGHIPNTKIFQGQVDLAEAGQIIHDGTKTSKEGVFATGELIDKKYRQAIVSAGLGAQAAIDAEHWLQSNNLA